MESDSLGIGLCGDGKSVQAAIDDFYVCVDEAKQDLKEKGKAFPDVKFTFIFDVGAFFNYYPLSISAFAKYIGMNASLLRQYAAGIKVPQAKSLEKCWYADRQTSSAICIVDRQVNYTSCIKK